MKRRKGWITLLVVIAIIALAATGLYRFIIRRQQQAAANALQKYESYTVTVSDIALTVQGSGAVAAATTTTVQAPQAGQVLSVKAEDGDRVKAGDVLVTFEMPDLDSEIAQLRSDLDTADQNLRRIKPTNGSTVIASPVEGRVKTVFVKKDDLIDPVVKANGSLMVISVDGMLTVTFTPAAGSPGAGLTAGQAVKVAIGTRTADGRVRSVAPDKAITVQFDDSRYYAVDAEAIVRSTAGAELGRGKVAISQTFPVTAVGGTVSSVSVAAGDSVNAGDTLVRLKDSVLTPAYLQALLKRDKLASDLAEKIALQKNEAITAPVDGIVSGLKLNANDMLKKDQAVCSVIDDTKIELTMNLDELDVPMVKLGQPASVTLDALPGRTYTAKVTKISAIGTYTGGVANYPVTITFDQPAGVLAGMSANAVITVSASSQVPVIPLNAMLTIDNRKYVLLADGLNADGTLKGSGATGSSASASSSGASATTGSGAANGTTASGGATGSNTAAWRAYLREVTIGLSTDNGAEIISGIQPGDRIAIPVAGSGQTGGFGMGSGTAPAGFGTVPRDLRPTTARATTSTTRAATAGTTAR